VQKQDTDALYISHVRPLLLISNMKKHDFFGWPRAAASERSAPMTGMGRDGPPVTSASPVHFLAPGLQGCNFLLLVAFIPLHQVFGCNPAAGVFPIKSHQQSPRSECQHNVRPGGPQAQVKGPHQCRPRTVTSKLHRQMDTSNMYTGSKSAGGWTSVMYAEEVPQQAAGVCSFCKGP